MQVFVNHQPLQTEATTLATLARELKLPAAGVAVALNAQMVTRSKWAETALTPDCQITVIKAACGG